MMRPNSNARYPVLFLIVGASLASAQAAGAAFREHTLATAASEMATRITTELKKRGDPSAMKVAIKPFESTDPDDPKNSAGSGISGKVQEQLVVNGVNVGDEGKYVLTGDYVVRHYEFGAEKRCMAQLNYVLKRGEETICQGEKQVYEKGVRRFTLEPGLYVTDPKDLAILAGGTLEASPTVEEPYKEANERPTAPGNKSRASDLVDINGSKVKAKSDGRFAVEILVADAASLPADDSELDASLFKPVQPELRDGAPYVSLKENQVYAVRIYNLRPFEAPYQTAATLWIDGLSSYYFSNSKNPKTGKDKYTGYRVFDESTLITGWYRDNEHADAFQPMELSKAPEAERLLQRTAQGTITVQFCACWPNGTQPIEYLAQNKGELITVRGHSHRRKLTDVVVEKGDMIASITIRYDRPRD